MVDTDRDEFIENNLALVHAVANKFRGRGAEYDDLFQAGCVGLIKAADNFDSERGFQFSTYAVPVIMGEIRRIFRDGGQIKVSRSLKEKSFAVQAVRDRFIAHEQREPTVSELAEATGYNTHELCEILNIINPVISLSADCENSSEQLDIPVDDTDRLFNKIAVSCALAHLSENERKLITLRYFEGKTQSEVSSVLGISQVQVSRREKALLQKLRTYLA